MRTTPDPEKVAKFQKLVDEEFGLMLHFATWVCEDVGVTGNLCAVELIARYVSDQRQGKGEP